MSSNGLRVLLRVIGFAALGVTAGTAPTLADCARSPYSTYVTSLRVIIETGGDDLRGGDDNVSLALNINTVGGSTWVMQSGRGGLNRFVRWSDWSAHTVNVPVADAAGCPVAVGAIRRVRLTTGSGGGVSGDNWNMRSIHIDWLTSSLLTDVLLDVPRGHTRDSYVFRFTGDRRTWEHDALPPRLVPR